MHEPTLLAFARHTLRWLRTIQSLQRWGYAFCFISFSVPATLLVVALARFSHGSVLPLEITVLARLVLHWFGADRPRAAADCCARWRCCRCRSCCCRPCGA
ncbi:MAG: hypothetical protein ACRESY_02380 [Steroidobacteraceae bacterium]